MSRFDRAAKIIICHIFGVLIDTFVLPFVKNDVLRLIHHIDLYIAESEIVLNHTLQNSLITAATMNIITALSIFYYHNKTH